MTILVLDLGSSSVRMLLFDERMTLLAQSSQRHRFDPETATLDMDELQARVEACIDEILANPQAQDIRAFGIDTFAGNLLGVDANGSAVTPIYTYGDTRGQEDVAALAQQVDVEQNHERTGCMLHTAYYPARLRWLRRTDPDLFGRVHQWIDGATFLYRRWFGDAPCTYSIASWSGMLNRATLDWDAQWLELLELPKSALPLLADYDAALSGLRPDYAGRWSALKNVPFYLAVGDGAAANVGAGCVEYGQVAMSVGTTAGLRTVSDEKLPSVPPGLWSYRITAKLHLIGGATTEGGNIFEWAKATLALPADAEQKLMQHTPDSHGLTFLPLLAGERSPGWAAHATGVIHGLQLATTPLDILQAALESVALRLALIGEQLGGDSVIVASGGALEHSAAWKQIFANALNRTINIAGKSEITARGAALLAMNALDKRPLKSDIPEITATVHPHPAGVKALRAARERQEALYRKFYGEPTSR